jgi:hypothetical protein
LLRKGKNFGELFLEQGGFLRVPIFKTNNISSVMDRRELGRNLVTAATRTHVGVDVGECSPGPVRIHQTKKH